MQPESNFDFLKGTEFFNIPEGPEMYESAICAENSYKNNKEYCALKARLFLDKFIHCVVRLKTLEFPQKPLTIGSYYSEPNTDKFYSVFGKRQGESFISINRASKPYLHTNIPFEDGLYKDIIENIYILLVWLLKQLDPNVKITTKYNKSFLPDNPYLAKDILFASARNIPADRKIKAFFPNCNTELLYQVEKKDGNYLLKDINTGKLVDTISMDPEIYSLEADVEKLRLEMKDAQNKYNTLLEKIDNAVPNEQYLQDIQTQAHRFNELEDRIINTVPTNKQMEELRNDLKNGLNDKTNIIKNQQTQINGLQDSIKDAQQSVRNQNKQFSQIKEELAATGIHMAESDAMLSHMSKRLNDNDEEIEAIRKETKDAIREVQQGFEEQGIAFYKKLDSIEEVLTRIALENMLLKERLEAIETNRTQPITEYMIVCTGSLHDLNESCNLYVQNHDVEEFKKKLAEAYMNYTQKVNNLDREQNAQQASDPEIYKSNKPDITDVEVRTISKEKSGKKKWFILAAVLLVMTFTIAFLIHRIKDVNDKNQKLLDMLEDKLNSGSEKSADKVDVAVTEPIKVVGNNNSTENTVSDILTGTDEPIITETPVTVPDNDQIPNVDDLYDDINTPIKAAESIVSIKGIDPDLVADIMNPDREFFNGSLHSKVDYSPDSSLKKSYIEEHEDIFEYIGRYLIPHFELKNRYGNNEAVSCTVGGYGYLIRYKSAKTFKFIYSRMNISSKEKTYCAGILPNDFCDSINGNSSLEDFQKVLGTRYYAIRKTKGTNTDLCTAEEEYGYVFTCENGDGVAVFFDENGKLCDYIYLLIMNY